MRLNMPEEKLSEIVAKVQEYVEATEGTIEDFIDGGFEGWECGDEEQQKWLDNVDADEITDWIVAGLR